ncbi:MAG: asparagine synthase (glutamine-hydrolyzing), partial [Candidatus Krumholzibacteriia bacterium]
MCGIAGIISPDHRGRLPAMLEVLVHRGPDDEGSFDDGVVALGQRRLSIIDLDGGRQPIASEDGSIQLICNGEIYNSPQLRRELQAAGHRFRTRTDVEVILHLYEDLGRSCVQKLQGMFAVAVWDSRRRTLLLARDHMGQKPLFYCDLGDTFLFASEVKAILATGLVQPEMDLDALWNYVSLRYLPDRYTLFRGIEKLPAATTLVRRDGRSALDVYWRPEFRAKLPGDEDAITDQLDQLLRETVAQHLLSDVPVGAFVSGGIDSSLVASLAAQAAGNSLPAFSIGVRDERFNELPYARRVVERHGLEGHERIVDPDLVEILPHMIRQLDEPSDPFGFGVYLVSQMAAERVKVVLGGDGGDESFA